MLRWPCGCRKSHPTRSGHQSVLVDETTEFVFAPELRRIWIGDLWPCLGFRAGRLLPERAVRPVPVVMVHEVDEDPVQLTTMKDEHAIQALAADRAHESFGK